MKVESGNDSTGSWLFCFNLLGSLCSKILYCIKFAFPWLSIESLNLVHSSMEHKYNKFESSKQKITLTFEVMNTEQFIVVEFIIYVLWKLYFKSFSCNFIYFQGQLKLLFFILKESRCRHMIVSCFSLIQFKNIYSIPVMIKTQFWALQRRWRWMRFPIKGNIGKWETHKELQY